jgi:S-adenosylmethionine hydrolase
MTDFGLKDGNVGVMKGVMMGIAPQAQLIDLSHLITPQNILEAALILHRSVPYFPPGTIHMVVVDPGVGTARRPMAARIGGQFYVGPDNGTITRWLERAENEGLQTVFIHLNRPEYWLPKVSHVFHGRDIFSPAAAHLAAGTPLEQLGAVMRDPVRIAIPRPKRTEQGFRAEVIHVDHFGNLSTSLYEDDLGEAQVKTVSLGGVTIQGLNRTFGERPPGELMALFGSTGNLIISEVNGNAAKRLGVQVGEAVEVVLA